MFDFGLGRATVRFVADATARGAERLREIVLAAVTFQTLAGAVAAVLLFAVAPLLVRKVFTVAPEMQPEAITMFRVLALHVPILLGSASLRATLEGAQRFDLSTSLRIPSSLASVAVPAVGAARGASLPTILWLLLIVRVVLFLVSAAAVSKALLPGRWALPRGFKTLKEMLRYSGWVAISAALGPALGSFDRFVVGSLVGVAGLGYYTGAAEAANRFLLIPATAFTALLPALSFSDAIGERERSLRVTRAARRQLAAVLLPLCLVLFVFAGPILQVWLGPAFGSTAGIALRVLSLGVFLTGLAHLPMALLYGSGRPDLPAKIHIFQVAVHVPLTFFFVSHWGVTGAAIAWSIRCAEDLVLYEWASRSAIGRPVSSTDEKRRTMNLVLATVSLGASLALADSIDAHSWIFGAMLVAFAFAFYAWWNWRRVLSADERTAWAGTLRPLPTLPEPTG
jgi:O-antigen/teichoic acid export membrane protein